MIGIVIGFVAAAAIYLVVLKFRPKSVIVYEFQRGLRYRNGHFETVLAPGRYWVFGGSTVITVVDIRPTFVSLVGQEVLTSDGVPVKVSVAANYEVVDPALAVNRQSNYTQACYLVLQLVIREIISGLDADDLIANRGGFAEKLKNLADPEMKGLGLKLISANLKDVMVSGDLKRTFAQVVKARKEAQAALERARGETAALRNLANAASMVRDNPELMSLRSLQAVAESSGNTFVLGLPASAIPIPVRRPDKPRTTKREDEKDLD